MTWPSSLNHPGALDSLLICSIMYHEVGPLLFSSSTFSFSDLYHLQPFMEQFMPADWALIQSVKIRYNHYNKHAYDALEFLATCT